jgi:hypothetical protein
MTALLIFWLVIAIVAIALAVTIRVYPLVLVAVGCVVSAGLAWFGVGLVYQVLVSLPPLLLCVYLWLRKTEVPGADADLPKPSMAAALGSLSNFSAFSDESDEVQVAAWSSQDATKVVFRGRVWKARLAKGHNAHPGLYRVREVRDAHLILEEATD